MPKLSIQPSHRVRTQNTVPIAKFPAERLTLSAMPPISNHFRPQSETPAHSIPRSKSAPKMIRQKSHSWSRMLKDYWDAFLSRLLALFVNNIMQSHIECTQPGPMYHSRVPAWLASRITQILHVLTYIWNISLSTHAEHEPPLLGTWCSAMQRHNKFFLPKGTGSEGKKDGPCICKLQALNHCIFASSFFAVHRLNDVNITNQENFKETSVLLHPPHSDPHFRSIHENRVALRSQNRPAVSHPVAFLPIPPQTSVSMKGS